MMSEIDVLGHRYNDATLLSFMFNIFCIQTVRTSK